MNSLKKAGVLIVALLSLAALGGCEKFLAEKPDQKLAVPTTLQDLQALMDDYNNVSGQAVSEGEMSSGDYYLNDDTWAGLSSESEKGIYVWNSKILHTDRSSTGWSSGYKGIYYSNAVLEGIENVARTSGNSLEWANIKGQATFFRAIRLLDMVWVWAPAYDEQTAQRDLGLPLRLNSNFNEVSKRASVAETYAQIIVDLKASASLLPIISSSQYRPSKAAAYGMLARTFISMRDYPAALLYADSCLMLNNKLLDYNSLNGAANFPVLMTINPELIFYRGMAGYTPMSGTNPKISQELYDSFEVNDLRRTIFFRKNPDGSWRFKGNYSGSSSYFAGLATDEVYLIRAESNARQGNIGVAVNDLNLLLSNRWKKTNGNSSYVPLETSDRNVALTRIIAERKKQLLMRGIRWMDIKRLNKDGANISLERRINGTSYLLPPNDLRFALPIPEDVISLSGMQQNPR